MRWGECRGRAHLWGEGRGRTHSMRWEERRGRWATRPLLGQTPLGQTTAAARSSCVGHMTTVATLRVDRGQLRVDDRHAYADKLFY